MSWKWGDGGSGEATVASGTGRAELDVEHSFLVKRGLGYLDPQTKVVTRDWDLWVYIDGYAVDGGHLSVRQTRAALPGEQQWWWHCETCGWNEDGFASQEEADDALAAHCRSEGHASTGPSMWN